jgi:hypothetical protein
MDFSKGFDKVSFLVDKLHHYAIRGKTDPWIKKFLPQRSQCVVVESVSSDRSRVPVESGVLQGSVLGPSLFLYYIYDMPEGLALSETFCRWHHCVPWLKHQIMINANIIQYDLNKLADWECAWVMKLHQEKCNVLTITNNRKILKKKFTLCVSIYFSK